MNGGSEPTIGGGLVLLSRRSMRMPMPRFRSWLFLLLAAASLLHGACRRGPPPRITLQDVERCERGIDLAASQATLQEVSSTFYRECSDTIAEPPCRQGFLEAARARPDQQESIVLDRCSRAYCPIFADRKLAACDPAFVRNAFSTPFAWAQLYDAILQRDASGYLPRLQRAFMAHTGTVAKHVSPAP